MAKKTTKTNKQETVVEQPVNNEVIETIMTEAAEKATTPEIEEIEEKLEELNIESIETSCEENLEEGSTNDYMPGQTIQEQGVKAMLSVLFWYVFAIAARNAPASFASQFSWSVRMNGRYLRASQLATAALHRFRTLPVIFVSTL